MDSLQTLSIKKLLDLYSWNEDSLQSIKTKIDNMINIININKLKEYYISCDFDGQFSKKLESSIICILNEMDDIPIIINCDDIKYKISTSLYDNGHIHHFMSIFINNTVVSYSFNHFVNSTYMNPYFISNISCEINDSNISDEIVLYGLFLWKYYNKYYHCEFHYNDDSKTTISIFC